LCLLHPLPLASILATFSRVYEVPGLNSALPPLALVLSSASPRCEHTQPYRRGDRQRPRSQVRLRSPSLSALPPPPPPPPPPTSLTARPLRSLDSAPPPPATPHASSRRPSPPPPPPPPPAAALGFGLFLLVHPLFGPSCSLCPFSTPWSLVICHIALSDLNA